MKADTHSLTAAPHTHTVELFSKSLQIPDVWVSLRVGGEEIDLSLSVVSSPLPFSFAQADLSIVMAGFRPLNRFKCIILKYARVLNCWLIQFYSYSIEMSIAMLLSSDMFPRQRVVVLLLPLLLSTGLIKHQESPLFTLIQLFVEITVELV